VMVKVIVLVQLLASVQVTVYTWVPVSPLKIPVVLLCGPKGLIVYVYIPVPPIALTVAAPVEPLQLG
jgi:hypothetical protein